jgi:hypothetical protein
VRRFALLLALFCLAIALSGCGSLGQAELKREVKAIGSNAREGQFVASDVAGDRTKVTFVRVHAGELADAAAHSAEKLADSEVAPELREERDRAVRIAMDVSDELGQLQVFPGDEGRAALVRDRLRQQAANADKLAGDL